MVKNLDETTGTKAKLRALVVFLERANDTDKMWAIALLSGRRPKRAVRSSDLRAWCAEVSGVPIWLMEESYHIVGDLAETLARLTPEPKNENAKSLSEWMMVLSMMPKMDLEVRKQIVLDAWDSLDEFDRFVFNKLLMGGFRLGVSQRLMTRAVAEYTNMDLSLVALRLMGDWNPNTLSWNSFVTQDDQQAMDSRPFPFALAHSIDGDAEDLGDPADFQAEWKWDGIRAQLIKRKGSVFLWSRGEELITQQFPEIEQAASALKNDGVWDGEILVVKKAEVQSFDMLQHRLGRKTISEKLLKSHPVVFRAYDTLELDGKDSRQLAQVKRSRLLSQVFSANSNDKLHFVQSIDFSDWQQLSEIRKLSRENRAEGLMLKRKDAPYADGRKRGVWWKWKLDPYTIDAVMIYAMRGHGRRANLYTDYTFALLNEDRELVPICKAYSGLTDAEIREVDAFVKKNTIERFGPVRSVKPELVFEIAFEGARKSTRHKSGVALRFPRIHRWRKDKNADQVDLLSDLLRII